MDEHVIQKPLGELRARTVVGLDTRGIHLSVEGVDIALAGLFRFGQTATYEPFVHGR